MLGAMGVTRAAAEALLFEFTRSDALRKHGLREREAIYACDLGRPLAEHVGFLIEALKPIAGEIGL